MDVFVVYNRRTDHFEHLLGHIVSKEGFVVDPDKVKAVIEASPPTNAKVLSQFLGQI